MAWAERLGWGSGTLRGGASSSLGDAVLWPGGESRPRVPVGTSHDAGGDGS